MGVVRWLGGLVLLALVLWLVARGYRSNESRPSMPSLPVSENGLVSPDPAPAASDAAERRAIEIPAAEPPWQPDRVLVRSAIGLNLEAVELETEHGWQVRALDQGNGLEIPGNQRPCRLRARGHLAASLAVDTRELTLEPHTALRFTSFPVAQVEHWTPTQPWENVRAEAELALLAGRVDDTTWAIAFDADRLGALFSDLAMEFRFEDGTSVLVDHDLSAGRNDSVPWPWPPFDVERAPLEVRVTGTLGLSGPFGTVVRSAALPESSSDFIAFAWGSAERRCHDEALELESPTPRFELGPLALGKDYLVTVRDVASGAHVRRRFTHDGKPLELVLTDGLAVSGRVTLEPSVGLRELERVTWSLGGDEAPHWRGEPRPIPLGPDGAFRFTLPDPVPWSEQAQFPRPTELELELRVPGFLPHRHACDTAGITELDLGTIAMNPRPSVATLAPGHGLDAHALFDQSLVLGNDPGFARELVVAGALPLTDGSLALTLDEESVPPEIGTCKALLLSIDDALVPLVRGPQGFQRVPTRKRVLRLVAEEHLTKLGERLEVGLDWRGILYASRSWPTRALREPTTLELELPEDARLWWGMGPRPEDRHRIALDAASVTLVRLP